MSKHRTSGYDSRRRHASGLLQMFGRAAAARAGDMPMRRVSSLSTSTNAESQAALKQLVSDTEYGDGRRADTYVTRLHPAKYLKCEPLFKELFFPILNMNRNFGFTSCSGIGGITAGLEADGGTTPLFDTPWAKSNGCWRGFAMFTVRSDAIAADAAYKLNCTPQVVGTTTVGGSSQDINSSYRRFNNGPSFINQVDNAQDPPNLSLIHI